MKRRTMVITKEHTFLQCMNVLQSPDHTKKHQLSPVKMSPSINLPKKSKHRFSPITVPGTTDHQNDKIPGEASSSGIEVEVSPTTYEKNNKEQDEDTDDELNDLFLYKKHSTETHLTLTNPTRNQLPDTKPSMMSIDA